MVKPADCPFHRSWLWVCPLASRIFFKPPVSRYVLWLRHNCVKGIFYSCHCCPGRFAVAKFLWFIKPETGICESLLYKCNNYWRRHYGCRIYHGRVLSRNRNQRVLNRENRCDDLLAGRFGRRFSFCGDLPIYPDNFPWKL